MRQIEEKQASTAFVAGSIGPLGVRLEPLGKVGLDEAHEAFAEQVRALVEGGPEVGVDLLIIEDDDFAGGGGAGDSRREE